MQEDGWAIKQNIVPLDLIKRSKNGGHLPFAPMNCDGGMRKVALTARRKWLRHVFSRSAIGLTASELSGATRLS
jgi:hypothetical protein